MNKLNKNKSPIAFQEEKIKKAKNIFEEFKNFTDGFSVLSLIHRNKEGGETNNIKYKKVITRNSDEFFDALNELVDIQMSSDIPYRIYSSVNERDFNKAIRKFKYEQLESDYYDQVQKENFYLDIRNRFLGCLMQPTQKATSYFLFDVDNVEGKDLCGETLNAIKDKELIVKLYPTKNGWHILTHPFNYTKIKLPDGVELKKDGLLLLSY